MRSSSTPSSIIPMPIGWWRMSWRAAGCYVAHAHPDHYFGLDLIKGAFPKTRIVAKAYTVEELKKTAQKKIDTWSPRLDANGPKAVAIPDLLTQDYLELEGRRLELIGPVQGDDGKILWSGFPRPKP